MVYRGKKGLDLSGTGFPQFDKTEKKKTMCFLFFQIIEKYGLVAIFVLPWRIYLPDCCDVIVFLLMIGIREAFDWLAQIIREHMTF